MESVPSQSRISGARRFLGRRGCAGVEGEPIVVPDARYENDSVAEVLESKESSERPTYSPGQNGATNKKYQTKGDGRGFRPPQEMKIRPFDAIAVSTSYAYLRKNPNEPIFVAQPQVKTSP